MSKFPGDHTSHLAAYGLFMVTWSVHEIVIEVAIAKQLGLGFLEANIVTSSLGYESRASILRSLLARHSPTYDDVISLISQTTQDSRRNAMAHGHVRVSKDTLDFIKRDAKHKFKASMLSFSVSQMIEHVQRLNDSVVKLQSRLGITDDDLEAFSNIGQNIANNASGGGNELT